QPTGGAGGMRQRDRDGVVELVADPDGLAHAFHAEQAARREPADRHDQARTDELELPVAPERAELLLLRRWRPVAASARSASRVATRDRRTVERRVERVLVELEPAAQRLAAAPGPRGAFPPFLAP